MKILFILLAAVTIIACVGGLNTNANYTSNENAIDISNVVFTKRAVNCAEYAQVYTSKVRDVQENTNFTGHVKISVVGDKCIFATNAIPNHNFNDGKNSFRNTTKAQNIQYAVPTQPSLTGKVTSLGLRMDNAIFLNGVKLDVLAAGCFGVGDGKNGCFDEKQPFRYDPMSPLNTFGIDSHHAHTQPDGTYHYHGDPVAMFDGKNDKVVSPVIGFAADGYPIYGSYFDDNGTIRKAVSSYMLKSGARTAKTFRGKNYDPGGIYDGRYVDDYEYNKSATGGDLDECNGMTVNGHYGYYVTQNYPWVLNCFKGTPDASFNKRMRGGGANKPLKKPFRKKPPRKQK